MGLGKKPLVEITVSENTNVSIVTERDGSRYATWSTGACSGRVKLPPGEVRKPYPDAAAFRASLWRTLNAVQALAYRADEQEQQWRKICSAALLPLQQLLGNARAGLEYDGHYAELCTALSGVEQQFRNAQRRPAAIEPGDPPKEWEAGKARTDTETTLEQLKKSVPTYPAREMALLLRLTVDSQPDNLPEALLRALKLIGIQAFFYDEAPEPLRQNGEYFGQPADTPSPVLVYQNGEKWMRLKTGTKRLIQK